MHRTAAVVAVLAAISVTGANGEAKELTEDNFEQEVFKGNKNFVFVKFQAPWWGHCKKLKPDWDKLGGVFNKADSKALIADVDCTADTGKKVCEKYGVEGYPTIKYFTATTGDDGEKYEEARDYNALKKFTKKMSKDPCNMVTLENCNKKEKAFIEEINAYDEPKIKSELETLSATVEEAKKKHKDLADLFEKQKDEAMATMKLQEEAKKEMDKVSKTTMFKVKILEQKAGKPKEEL